MATPRSGVLKTPARTPGNKLKDPVEVFCRVRPLSVDDNESCVEVISSTEVQLNLPKTVKTVSTKIEQVTCKFSRVFTAQDGQEVVFNEVGLPLAEDLLQGKNGLCFMYGITGSGKTHTMNGSTSDGGVLPRCLDVIFNSIGDLQTKRCVFRPDGYNGFEAVSEEEAKQSADRFYQELELKGRAGKNRIDMETGDLMRIPDRTRLPVDEDTNYAVFISFVEIYNNSVYDLLDEAPVDTICPKPPASKILREDRAKNMFVYETTEIEVKSTEEAYEIFWRGQNKRRTAHTALNAESSRSHSVFNIRLVQAPLNLTGDAIVKDAIGVSQLSLCDLAGSERMGRTQAGGERTREAGNINNSLMTLRSCIECLRENQKHQEAGSPLRMVPYRDSKLTHLFKNYFDGDGKVRMIVCLNPRAEDFDESLHVAKFAELTQEVKIARADGVKFDLGFTPGRGKARKFMPEELEEELDSDSDIGRADEEFVFPQYAPWPSVVLSSLDDRVTLPNLLSHLEERMRIKEQMISEWLKQKNKVRAMIIQLEEENDGYAEALEELRSSFNEKEREIESQERKVRSLTLKIETLTRSSQTYETQIRQRGDENERLKAELLKEKQANSKLKQTLKDLTSTERLRWEKECNRRVREAQMEMEGAVMEKSWKLRQLKTVVEGMDVPDGSPLPSAVCDLGGNNMISANQAGPLPIVVDIHINNEKPTETKTTSAGSTSTTVANFRSKKFAVTGVSKTPGPGSVAAKPPSRIGTKTTTSATPKPRSRSPPPVATKPAPVRAKHRRSRSSDYWLEHKPADILATDTIMQPKLGSKKTVTVPKVKDLKGLLCSYATPNYILTHQEEDSCGEIETKLFKGEVLRTRSGGTSVQFTDVETLRKHLEEKPVPKPPATSTPRNSRGNKRSSADREEGANIEDIIETRCAVGIEGRPNAEPALNHYAKKMRP